MNSPPQNHQIMGQEINSKEITKFQVMNGLNEVPTQSASPIFTQNQLQVVEAVWQTADSSFRIKRFVINLSAADRNSLIMFITLG